MLKKYQAIQLDGIKVLSIETINYRPHPFVIGSKHIMASGGYLTEDVMRKVPCAHCKKPYDQHTYDRVLFIQFTRDLERSHLQTQLEKLIAAGVSEDKIDGFTFVETPEKFRLLEVWHENN